MLKRLELSPDAHLELKEHCVRRGIDFLSTPFDESAARFLHSIGVTTFKIPSGSVTDYPLLREVNGFGAKVFLSTGMATLVEISEALDVLARCDVTLLHCTTEYPCPYDCANLHVMETMRKRFGLPVGYSDHTQGLAVSIAAVALGAKVLEKHVTLDRGMSGPDHKASIEPDELKKLIAAIRNVEAGLGNGEKILSPGEVKNMAVARKSIHASRFIRKGTVFSEDDLIAKRPGTGCSPMLWNKVIGKIAQKDYNVDEMISVDLS